MIYDINGNPLSHVYDIDGNELNNAYNIDGNIIYTKDTSGDPYIASRKLVFEDTFLGNSLNTSNWSYETGNVRNNELQFYRAQNVSVENSNLVITAKKENHLNKTWTSGSITGQLKRYWKYGRFEGKIKFVETSGIWGGFWMLGSNHWIEYSSEEDSSVANNKPKGSVPWPKCGEIDICEILHGIPSATLWKYSGGSCGTGTPSQSIDISEWHVYAMEWTSEYISMQIDGTEIIRWNFSDYSAEEMQAYHLPQYFIVNLAVGGAGGTPSASATEMKMYVDWIRVYAPLES